MQYHMGLGRWYRKSCLWVCLCGGDLWDNLVRSLDGGDLLLLLSGAFGNEGFVFGLLLLLTVHPSAVKTAEMTTALETDGGNETLDFGSLGIRLRIRLLGTLYLPPNNILPHIILFRQIKKPPDLRRPLRAQSLRQYIFRQTREGILALLDNNEGEDGDVGAYDAATDGLALALTCATGAVAAVAIGKEELHSVWEEDTLLHGETLLVIATCDTEYVAFKFVPERVGRDFLCNLFVVENTNATLVINVDCLLFPSCGVCDVEFHA